MIMQLFLNDVYRYWKVKCCKAYIVLSKGLTKYIYKYTTHITQKREIKQMW